MPHLLNLNKQSSPNTSKGQDILRKELCFPGTGKDAQSQSVFQLYLEIKIHI